MASGNKNITIAAGESLSNVIDIDDRGLVSIMMPAAWTAADISFLVSLDGVNFLTKLNAGVEYKVSDLIGALPVADQAIDIYYEDFIGYRYIQFRSGLEGAEVNQVAERTFKVGLAG